MKTKKILIVEDDSILQKTLQEFLSTEGFETTSASDGEKAVELARSGKPDLILLDIILPKKDGYEVIKDLKSDQGTRSIPIILLTNLGSMHDVEKALNLGATTYLVKADYKLEEVVAKIKEVLSIN
ncbi:MAG: response regulator [Candidatus Moranbacteria bacterium]|nr:response regulator [Candidatus Moranbacteria bacterium]